MTDLTQSGLQINLASTGARFTPTGLWLPEALPEGDWAKIGQGLLRGEQVLQWWIGDWAAFGSPHSEMKGWRKKGGLTEFCRLNEFDYGTISNKATISRSIHLSLRRESVPLSFFAVLSPLKPKEQQVWLSRIEQEKLSRGDLRRAIRISQGEQNALLSDGPIMEYGTKYFDDLKAWLKNRPKEFWDEPERLAIWTARIAELAQLLPVSS
jgi:hypothetical protein